MIQDLKLFLFILCLAFPVPAQTGMQLKSVKISAIVIDEAKKPVKDIRREEIIVLEKGEPQTISSISNENQPLIYALTVDNSGSFQKLLELVQHALKLIVDENEIDDETVLIRFVDSEKIEVAQEFTKEKPLLIEAVDNLFVEGGQTALFDAIYLSVEKVSQHKPEVNSRRAVIVMTDGEERDSYYSEGQLRKLLEKEDVQVFFIGIVELLSKERAPGESSPKQIARNRMEKIAQKSGGMAFFPKSPKEFGEISLKIKELIRGQYVINYSVRAGREKECHKPKVEFAKDLKRKDVKIIVRDGCFSTNEK